MVVRNVLLQTVTSQYLFFGCYRTRIWVLVEVAPPQSGTVESEDSLPQVTWPPSLKVYSKCKSRESLLDTFNSCFSLDFTILIELSFASIFNCLQIATVFVWNLTAFQTVEERTCQRECSIPSGCPSTRSTTSFYMTYWMVPTACSWKRGSRCVLVTTSRETRTWKVTASWFCTFHRNWPSFCTRSALTYVFIWIYKRLQVLNISLSPFVLPDLTWIQVRNAEEAWRVLRAGRRNQSFASTHLNQNSSRR